MTLIKNQAIQTALTGDWNSAITLNQQLLKEDPNDIETLNRLAFALNVLGRIKEAKQTYQKVLKIDHHNPIALKNLKRLSELPAKNEKTMSYVPLLKTDPMFIEESGKTKVIELINVAEPHVIRHLMTAELLELRIKRLKIFILDKKNHYIGMLPENIGKRLIKLIKAGSTYETYIKAIENHKVIIFMREVKKPSRFKNLPSFLSNDIVKTVSIKKHYHSKPDAEEAGDEASEDSEE